MSSAATAFVAGAFEHPGRRLPDKSVAQIHAEVALGALSDAGLSLDDVDGYLCSGDAPGGATVMADFLGLRVRYVASTDIGGSSYVTLADQAATAIENGDCEIALITMAGRPRTGKRRSAPVDTPFHAFEGIYGHTTVASYALAARRHMHEFGTTAAQLAEVKVAASRHAQHNPDAMLRDPVTADDVLASPMIADPLHRLDCCVITDGGGALVVVSEAVARKLSRQCVKVLGSATTVKHTDLGRIDLTHTGAVVTGPLALERAGVRTGDIDYASIYDSFTITVVQTIEDLGFCAKGEGGKFVEDGTLRAPHGALPVNTDGGSLCNNHPANRGGLIRTLEAVRQLRGEAASAVQVPDCAVALVHGTGGYLGSRMGSATMILGRDE
ncbi:thiolase domain-containing protein [Amycolatopsis acidicola]|uniref:Thiolase domain-containing protein n=1 Tax=Amycolatopsis acidicola TaxID=2596893 RepID=A0A5N0VG08_9PSEU|nr:thiolase domain-containing protein [Amycolatopsis acidicola]KAA9164374.1 thiolase domain-containing protein [Amycolatopsis acidicola]